MSGKLNDAEYVLLLSSIDISNTSADSSMYVKESFPVYFVLSFSTLYSTEIFSVSPSDVTVRSADMLPFSSKLKERAAGPKSLEETVTDMEESLPLFIKASIFPVAPDSVTLCLISFSSSSEKISLKSTLSPEEEAKLFISDSSSVSFFIVLKRSATKRARFSVVISNVTVTSLPSATLSAVAYFFARSAMVLEYLSANAFRSEPADKPETKAEKGSFKSEVPACSLKSREYALSSADEDKYSLEAVASRSIEAVSDALSPFERATSICLRFSVYTSFESL